MPAQLAPVDTRELVEVLSRDPEWLRRQFDAIVATSFPPAGEPPSGPAVTVGTAGPAPAAAVTDPAGRSRMPDGADVVTGARHGHRQRSPPGLPRHEKPGVEEVMSRREPV